MNTVKPEKSILPSHPEIQVRDGIAYIAESRLKVRDLVIEQKTQGWTPQQLQESHNHLPLATIQAALAYYNEHREEIDREILEDERETDRLLAELAVPPVDLEALRQRQLQKNAAEA